MSEIVTSVFTAADALRGVQLQHENARLRAALAQANERIAAYDQRLDLLQRANEAKDSPKFAVRQEAS